MGPQERLIGSFYFLYIYRGGREGGKKRIFVVSEEFSCFVSPPRTSREPPKTLPRASREPPEAGASLGKKNIGLRNSR